MIVVVSLRVIFFHQESLPEDEMSRAPVSNLASRRLIRGAGHPAAAAAGAAETPACREQASEAGGRQQVRYRELMGEKQVLSAHHSFPNSHHPTV